MALLARLLRRRPFPTPDLTPDEEAYKVKTWRQVETLVGPALKDDPADFARVKDKALAEIDQHILYARTVGKTAQQLDDERVAELNRQLAARREVLQNGYALTQEDFTTTIHPADPGRHQLHPGSRSTLMGRAADRRTPVQDRRRGLPHIKGRAGRPHWPVRHRGRIPCRQGATNAVRDPAQGCPGRRAACSRLRRQARLREVSRTGWQGIGRRHAPGNLRLRKRGVPS